jgi:predicted transcriptional regulator of viral defense system
MLRVRVSNVIDKYWWLFSIETRMLGACFGAIQPVRSADFFATHPVFTRDEFAVGTASRPDRSPRTVDGLLAKQVAAGRLLRVRRGLYAPVPPGADPHGAPVDPYLVATHLAPDATVAYHAALQFRGKAYSVWHRFHVLVGGQLRPFRFQGNEFVRAPHPQPLRHRPDLGGGIRLEPYAGGEVRVTTLERTLVDVLDQPGLCGGWEEVWRSLEQVEFFDLDEVLAYAMALGSALTSARVGFFLEQHRDALFVEDRHLATLRKHAPKQPRYLDATRTTGRLVKGWNLIVPERVLRRTWEEADDAVA